MKIQICTFIILYFFFPKTGLMPISGIKLLTKIDWSITENSAPYPLYSYIEPVCEMSFLFLNDETVFKKKIR